MATSSSNFDLSISTFRGPSLTQGVIFIFSLFVLGILPWRILISVFFGREPRLCFEKRELKILKEKTQSLQRAKIDKDQNFQGVIIFRVQNLLSQKFPGTQIFRGSKLSGV